jgi:AcrR family transcriptional regulator
MVSRAAKTTIVESDAAERPADRKGEWRRSAQTKNAVMEAARRLFNEHGYENTGIGDIVQESGVSVGSIYHQFGGKREVFEALVEHSMSRHRAVSSRAANKAIAAGETDPLRIYVAGARAFLMDTWEHRDIDRVTLLLEGPADVVSVSQEKLSRLLHGSRGVVLGNQPVPDCAGYALFGLLTGAARRLVDVGDRRTARAVVEYFIDLILRMGQENPTVAPEGAKSVDGSAKAPVSSSRRKSSRA